MARPQPLPKMTFDEFLEWESRQEQRNDWQPQVLFRPEDAVEIDCPPGTTHGLTLAEIYRGLDFGV